jgi:hypothetical protein
MFKRYKMETKTTTQNTKNDAITTTLLKLYERFAPEEVKGSKLETVALGGFIFQTIIMIALFGGFAYPFVKMMLRDLVNTKVSLWVCAATSGTLLGIPFISFYLAQRIRNPGSRNHRISIRLLQGLVLSWVFKAVFNFLF